MEKKVSVLEKKSFGSETDTQIVPWFRFPIPDTKSWFQSHTTSYTILAHCAEPLNLDSLALFYCHTLLDFSAEIQGFLRHFTA